MVVESSIACADLDTLASYVQKIGNIVRSDRKQIDHGEAKAQAALTFNVIWHLIYGTS